MTIVANYIPLEEPAGGPNFAQFDDDVLYEINVDNNGDARGRHRRTSSASRRGLQEPEHVPLQHRADRHRSTTRTWNRAARPTRSRWSIATTKTSTVLAENVPTPPVNIGPRSTPNYEAVDGGRGRRRCPAARKVFAGQRDDPFFVDLGSVFDLGGLRPFNTFHLLPLPARCRRRRRRRLQHAHDRDPGPDLADLQAAPPNKVAIGVYASASRQKLRILADERRRTNAGNWVQVSRLGNPLVNEVIIPLGQKDRWNRVRPGGRRAVRRVLHDPSSPGSINFLYPGLLDIAHEPAATTWSRSCSRASPGAEQLHRATPGRPAPAEHRHRAHRRRSVPATALGAARRRHRGLPERPPARGRRHRHRAAGGRRATARSAASSTAAAARALQPEPEQPARRRRRRERPAVPTSFPYVASRTRATTTTTTDAWE